MAFERTGGEEVYEGQIFTVRRDRFRHDDGEEVTRDVVAHPGAVAAVVHDGERLFLVAQPREAVGDPALLELPAGKLDEEDEDPLATMKRELAEEIGKGARRWEHLTTFFSSAGFCDEEVHVYLATDLHDAEGESEKEERIEVREVPLSELDEVIAGCRDAKTLVGLLWFRAYRASG
ncbi:MAG: NUDIX hydrolase [Actinomycetota bacterium]|nr:NUDIX hydrolase [Actinomycetota bacterium]